MVKFIVFIVALLCLGSAHYLMWDNTPLVVHVPDAGKILAPYRLDIFNLDNTILGVGLLLLGIVLLVISGAVQRFWPASTVAPSVPSAPTPPRAILRLPVGWQVALLVGSALLALAYLVWQLVHETVYTTLPLPWLGAMVGFAVAAFLADRAMQPPLLPTLDRYDVLWISGIFVVGLAVGAHQLQHVPAHMVGDEGAFWLFARAIARGVAKHNVFGLHVYTFPVGGSLYQGWVVRLFGESLWSWRFASVLAGVAAVVPTYALARELFERRVAVLAGVILMFTPFFLSFARLGYNNSQSLFPFAAALYLLYAGLKRKSIFYLFASGAMAGLGFYTYTAAKLALIVAGCFLVYVLVEWPRLHQEMVAHNHDQPLFAGFRRVLLIGVFGVGFGVVALPLLLSTQLHYADHANRKMAESFLAEEGYASSLIPKEELYRDYPPLETEFHTFFYRPDLYVKLILRGFVRSFLAFHHPHLARNHFIISPIPGPVAVVFYTVGMVAMLVHIRRPQSLLLLLWFFISFIMLSMLNTFPPRHTHLVPIIVVVAIISAVGVCVVADYTAVTIQHVTRAVESHGNTPAFAVMMIGASLIAFTGFHNYFGDVQERVRPNYQDIMGFTALEVDKPVQMVFIYNDPEQLGFIGGGGKPFMVNMFPNQVDFANVHRDSLDDYRVTVKTDRADGIEQDYIFFFFEEDTYLMLPFLKGLFDEPVLLWRHLGSNDEVVLVSYSTDGEVYVP
jgi:hypothetical protein